MTLFTLLVNVYEIVAKPAIHADLLSLQSVQILSTVL